MIDYYTMESVRYLISRKYDVRAERENPVPLPSWNRYPCPIIKGCEKKRQIKCIGHISVFVNSEKIRWRYLEICFFREKQRAFIRVDSPQMRKLFELGIIATESILEKETF
jgi:hypothetical protein